MIFRRITAEKFDALLQYVIEAGISYDIRCRAGVTYFGLSAHEWYKLDFNSSLISASA